MTHPPSQTLLDDRYGRNRRRSFDTRIAWGVGSALTAAGLAFALFGGWQQGSNIAFTDLHYEVESGSSVRVEAQVTASADTAVLCEVEALSPSRSTVGWKLVRLPAGDDHTRRFTTTLITVSPATTGRVRSCWEQPAD